MNEHRLRELMNDSVEGVEASDSLRTKVSAAIGGTRVGRRLAVRGWIAVGGAGLAAAAVLLVAPLVRPPSSAPTGPAVEQTVSSTSGSVSVSVGPAPVDDVASVLGSETWYVVRVVSQGTALALAPGVRTEEAMRIELTGAGLQGYDGCNWIGADPAMLSSVPSATVGMSRTDKGCTTKTVGQDEFIAGLQDGPKSWTRSGQDLVLTTRDQQITFSTMPLGSSPTSSVAELDIVATLKSSTWYVTRIVADGIPVQVFMPSNRERALRIQVKGASLTGFDGCNWIGATTAALSSAPLTQVGWSQTDGGCVPIPAGQKEFVAALHESGKSWTSEGGGLVLLAANYEVSFDSTPPTPSGATTPPQQDVAEMLGSKTWYVTGILENGESIAISSPVDSEQAMRLQLLQTGLQGFDGCNRIGASPALLSSGVPPTVGLSQTGKLCTPAPAGQKEYVDALQARDKWWLLNGDELVLRAGGYEVTFSATPPPSAVPTTSG